MAVVHHQARQNHVITLLCDIYQVVAAHKGKGDPEPIDLGFEFEVPLPISDQGALE